MAALAVPAWAYVGDWLHYRSAAAGVETGLPDRIPLSPTPVATVSGRGQPDVRSPSSVLAAGPSPAPTAANGGKPVATSATRPAPTQLPALQGDFGRPVKLSIPSIGVAADVTPTGVEDGVYQVPWWDVGWQKDSAVLGQPGNTVLNGHVHTIDAGDVFYHLSDLKPGDLVYAYSQKYRTAWVVESTEVGPNTQTWFVAPSHDVRMTMYTCEGTFDLRTRTFSDYRVVVAKLMDATPRTTSP